MVCSLSNYQPISSHIFKQNHASNLSSTFLSSPSSIHLSSDLSICLQFRCNNKKLCSSTPRPLTVIAMVPPKLGGKANKVTGITKPTLEAGKAKPAPPVGPTLGSKGGFV